MAIGVVGIWMKRENGMMLNWDENGPMGMDLTDRAATIKTDCMRIACGLHTDCTRIAHRADTQIAQGGTQIAHRGTRIARGWHADGTRWGTRIALHAVGQTSWRSCRVAKFAVCEEMALFKLAIGPFSIASSCSVNPRGVTGNVWLMLCFV